MGCNSSSRTGGIFLDELESESSKNFSVSTKISSLWSAYTSGSPLKQLNVKGNGDANSNIMSRCSELKKISIASSNCTTTGQAKGISTNVSLTKAKDFEVNGRNIILQIVDTAAYATFVEQKTLQETVLVFKIFRGNLPTTSVDTFKLMDDTLQLLNNKYNDLTVSSGISSNSSGPEELDQKRSSSLLEEMQVIDSYISQLATLLRTYELGKSNRQETIAEARSALLSLMYILKKCRRIDQSIEVRLSDIFNSLILAFANSHPIHRDVSWEGIENRGIRSELSSSSSVQSSDYESNSLLKLINDVMNVLNRRSVGSNSLRQPCRLSAEEHSMRSCSSLDSAIRFSNASPRQSSDHHMDTESKESLRLSPSSKSRDIRLSSRGKFDECSSPAIRPTLSLSTKSFSTPDDFSYKSRTSPAYRNSLLAATDNSMIREKPELIKLDFSEGTKCLVDDEYGFFDVESSL